MSECSLQKTLQSNLRSRSSYNIPSVSNSASSLSDFPATSHVNSVTKSSFRTNRSIDELKGRTLNHRSRRSKRKEVMRRISPFPNKYPPHLAAVNDINFTETVNPNRSEFDGVAVDGVEGGCNYQKTFISIDPRKEIHEVEEMDIADSDDDDDGSYKIPAQHYLPAVSKRSKTDPPRHAYANPPPLTSSTPYIRDAPRNVQQKVVKDPRLVDPRLRPKIKPGFKLDSFMDINKEEGELQDSDSTGSSIGEDSIASEDSIDDSETFESAAFPVEHVPNDDIAASQVDLFAYCAEDNYAGDSADPSGSQDCEVSSINEDVHPPDHDFNSKEVEVQGDDIDLLRVQLLGSIKSKKSKSAETSPPQQLIAQRYEVTDPDEEVIPLEPESWAAVPSDELEDGELANPVIPADTAAAARSNKPETRRRTPGETGVGATGGAGGGNESTDSSSASDGEARAHLVKRISKRRIVTKPVTIEEVVAEIDDLPSIDNKTFDMFHNSRGCKKRAKKRAKKLKISPLQLLKEELHYDHIDKEWFIAPITSSQMPKHAYSYARILKSFKNKKVEKEAPVTMSVEMLQQTRRKRLQKFFELAESTTAGFPPKPLEKMKITIGKISGSDIIKEEDNSKFVNTFQERRETSPEPSPVASSQTSSKESPSPSKKLKGKGDKSINIKIPLSDSSIECDKKESAATAVPPDRGTEVSTEKDVTRRRTMSEDDLDGMRDLLLKSMIRKDKPDKLKKAPLPLVNIKNSRNNSPTASPPRHKIDYSSVNESLMPRKLETLTPSAIRESALITKQIIAKYLVNEDLRMPIKPKDDQLKQKYQRKITPIVPPVIITVTNDSESESDSSPVKPSLKKPSTVPKTNAIITKSLEELSKLTDKLKDIDNEMMRLRSERQNVVDSIKFIKDTNNEDNVFWKEAKSSTPRLLQQATESSSSVKSDAKAPKIDNKEKDKQAKYGNKVDKIKSDGAVTEQLISEDGLEPGEVLTDVSDAFSDTSSEKDGSGDNLRGPKVESIEGDEVQDEEQIKHDDSPVKNPVLSSVEGLLQFCNSKEESKSSQVTGSTMGRISSDIRSTIKLTAFPTFKHIAPPSKETCYRINTKKYISPLLIFRSYRFSPYFRTKAKLSLKSTTFSHNIRPSLELCQHDLHGKCLDKSCKRQHLSTATSISGPHIRTQLCFSAGIKMAQLQKFEQDHKNLSDEELTLFFCNYLNSLRQERSKNFYFVNTTRIPKLPVYRNYMSSSKRHKQVGTKDRVDFYSSADNNSNIRYETKSKEISRYYIASEVSLSQQCKRNPRDIDRWLLLANCQKSRGNAIVASTLSKALQANRHSVELWLEYLKVKSGLITKTDLVSLYQQAIKFAPSPYLWRNMASLLQTYGERIDTLNSALELAGNDKSCYGSLIKDKLLLCVEAGHDATVFFKEALDNLDSMLPTDMEWLARQYIYYKLNSRLTDEEHLVTLHSKDEKLLLEITGVVDAVIDAISDADIRLGLHRLRLTAITEMADAVQYITYVTDTHPDMYQLLEETVLLGGWVDPDILWPRLCFLEMKTAMKTSKRKDVSIEIATKMLSLYTGEELHSDNVLQTYREVLGVCVGKTVLAEYAIFSEGIHRVWLFVCFAFLASLYPVDPVYEFKIFATKLSYVSVQSPQLNILRYAISVEPSTAGAQILWERYFEVIEDLIKTDKDLLKVYYDELKHCLNTLPTLQPNKWDFHDKVLSKLLLHTENEDGKIDEMLRAMTSQTTNKSLYMMFANAVSARSPLLALQYLKFYLNSTDVATSPDIWIKCLELSQLAQSEEETRILARSALRNHPLSYQVLLEVLKFEVRTCGEDSGKVDLCKWAINRAQALGLSLRNP